MRLREIAMFAVIVVFAATHKIHVEYTMYINVMAPVLQVSLINCSRKRERCKIIELRIEAYATDLDGSDRSLHPD